jgi:hypothetical protein
MQIVLEAVLAAGAGMSWWMVGNLILGDVIDLTVTVMRGFGYRVEASV